MSVGPPFMTNTYSGGSIRLRRGVHCLSDLGEVHNNIEGECERGFFLPPEGGLGGLPQENFGKIRHKWRILVYKTSKIM